MNTAASGVPELELMRVRWSNLCFSFIRMPSKIFQLNDLHTFIVRIQPFRPRLLCEPDHISVQISCNWFETQKFVWVPYQKEKLNASNLNILFLTCRCQFPYTIQFKVVFCCTCYLDAKQNEVVSRITFGNKTEEIVTRLSPLTSTPNPTQPFFNSAQTSSPLHNEAYSVWNDLTENTRSPVLFTAIIFFLLEKCPFMRVLTWCSKMIPFTASGPISCSNMVYTCLVSASARLCKRASAKALTGSLRSSSFCTVPPVSLLVSKRRCDRLLTSLGHETMIWP